MADWFLHAEIAVDGDGTPTATATVKDETGRPYPVAEITLQFTAPDRYPESKPVAGQPGYGRRTATCQLAPPWTVDDFAEVHATAADPSGSTDFDLRWPDDHLESAKRSTKRA